MAQAKPQEQSPAMRSSKSRFEILPLVRTEKQNLANDLAALGLLMARRNRDRHPSIQDFMLANDSCTIASYLYVSKLFIATFFCLFLSDI